MVGNVTIQGQIVGTATFDGAKISAVVTIAPPINATVVFGKSGVSVHNELTGRDAENAHPKESITGLTISDSPEFANTKITTLDSVANGGIIPTDEATWLGATAKSVLSYLQKLVSKVYYISNRVTDVESVSSSNTSTITNILLNFTEWVLGTYLGALTLLDAAIAAGDSLQAMAGKLQGQLNAVKVRLGLLEDDIIYELTLSAAVQNFTISHDKNNNALSISECRLIIITPSATTANFLFRINGIIAAVYNGMAANGITSFASSFGQDGSVCDMRLMYDNTANIVAFTGLTARKYPTNLFQTVPSSGFTNPGSVTTKISSITLLTNTGLFAVGTKVILKKK